MRRWVVGGWLGRSMAAHCLPETHAPSIATRHQPVQARLLDVSKDMQPVVDFLLARGVSKGDLLKVRHACSSPAGTATCLCRTSKTSKS